MGIRTSARGPSAGAAPSRSTAAPPSLADYAFPEPWNTSLQVPLGLEPRAGGRRGSSQAGCGAFRTLQTPSVRPWGAAENSSAFNMLCLLQRTRARTPYGGPCGGPKGAALPSGGRPSDGAEGGAPARRLHEALARGADARYAAGGTAPGTPATPPTSAAPGRQQRRRLPGPCAGPDYQPQGEVPEPAMRDSPPAGAYPGPGAVLERAPYNGCRSRSSAPGGGTLKTSSKVARNHRGAACALLSGPAYHESSWL